MTTLSKELLPMKSHDSYGTAILTPKQLGLKGLQLPCGQEVKQAHIYLVTALTLKGLTVKRKVACVYNKFFFENLYAHMRKNDLDTCIDASDTYWHLVDVEDILIKEYGYRRTSGGIM